MAPSMPATGCVSRRALDVAKGGGIGDRVRTRSAGRYCPLASCGELPGVRGASLCSCLPIVASAPDAHFVGRQCASDSGPDGPGSSACTTEHGGRARRHRARSRSSRKHLATPRAQAETGSDRDQSAERRQRERSRASPIHVAPPRPPAETGRVRHQSAARTLTGCGSKSDCSS